MASSRRLLFREFQPAPTDLLFGRLGEAPPDQITITLSARLPPAAARLPVVDTQIATLDAQLPTWRAAAAVRHDNAVNRGPKLYAGSPWQRAGRQPVAVASPQESPARVAAEITERMAAGRPAPAMLSESSAQMGRVRPELAAGWRAGVPAGRDSAAGFADMTPLRDSLPSTFTNALRRQQAAQDRWKEMFRNKRPSLQAGWERAAAILERIDGGFDVAIPLPALSAVRWQATKYPPPGVSKRPPEPPPVGPCYEPDATLLFSARMPATGILLFACPSSPGQAVIVPIRRVYLVENSFSLRLADDNMEIPCGSLSLAIDVDSWSWGMSDASVPAKYLPFLQAGKGDLVEVIASINGHEFRLCIDAIRRHRKFGSAALAISGKGRAAWLAEPYADIRNRFNNSPRTAQQLMADALTENGVPIGWDIDWRITDWLVPAGAWSHSGTAMEACLAIAEAGGAYLQAHPSEQILHVLPRYPAAPWHWADLMPDIELPEDVCVTEGLEWVDKAAYNTVFVAGQAGGVLCHVTRAGTAGDVAAPMVTDSLITHADAGRQRGTRILSDTGRQKLITLSLPVLEETGIIRPGNLIRYHEGGNAHVGLTRSVSVTAQFPKIRQSILLESHVIQPV